MVHEGLLHRMGPTVLCQSLDRGDLATVLHHRQGQAGIDALAVDQHRAGAALAAVAPLLGTGQSELVAQRVEQADAWLDQQLVFGAVDAQSQGLRGNMGRCARLRHRGLVVVWHGVLVGECWGEG
jgi:hypothetical protein